jgi:VIT1/CCC1 family predicted Fe2+/Mn2+ transporter
VTVPGLAERPGRRTRIAGKADRDAAAGPDAGHLRYFYNYLTATAQGVSGHLFLYNAAKELAPLEGNAVRMATENRARADTHGHDHGHHHRDVSGGWLRPAVFGAMDGLVTNVSLIAGVGGGGGSSHTIILTGLAGLAAGACSMAAGEYVSVSSQNELVQAEVNKERLELENNPVFEQAELATMLRARGVSAATARQAAAEISAFPDKALAVHALEELGVDPGELPSPVVAAGASLGSFAVGAVIPLIPYLAGLHLMVLALGFAAVAAIAGGGMVARLTDRPFWRGAVRQLVLGACAAAVTYLIGVGVGHVAG